MENVNNGDFVSKQQDIPFSNSGFVFGLLSLIFAQTGNIILSIIFGIIAVKHTKKALVMYNSDKLSYTTSSHVKTIIGRVFGFIGMWQGIVAFVIITLCVLVFMLLFGLGVSSLPNFGI